MRISRNSAPWHLVALSLRILDLLFVYFSEWLTHQHRDTLSSIVGHPTLASYLAIAENEAIGRIKLEMTEVGAMFRQYHHQPALSPL